MKKKILNESSSFPFQNNQYNETNESPSKQSVENSLINISKNNQKRIIACPDGTRTNARKVTRNINQQAKRVHAPFATDTPPISSARRSYYKKPQIGRANQKVNLSHGKADIKNLIQFENIDTNSPRRLNNENIKNKQTSNQVYQEINSESIISSFPNTNISPIQQTDFQNVDLPILPSSRNILKVSQFPKRVRKIESFVKEHQKFLNELSNIVESRIPKKSSKSLSMIKELVNMQLNNSLSNKIQSTLSDLFEKNSTFEKHINNLDQMMQNEFQQTNDSLNEQKAAISQFSNSINSFESSHIVTDSMNDVSRLNDKISFTISDKLKSIENDEVFKLTSSQNLQENFDLIKSSLSDKINTAKNQTIFTIENEHQKLLEQIQLESAEQTKKTCDHLSSEIQNLSNSLESTFTEFKETVEQTSISMNLSLEEFEKSLQEAVDDITSESNESKSELSERLNNSMENSQKSFEIFRKEIQTTINAIQKNNIKNNENLFLKIKAEYEKIKQNSADVQKKFDNFISFVVNERNIQLRYFFDSNESSEFDKNNEIQSVFKMDPSRIITNDIAPDLALLKYSIDCVNSTESRIQELESSLEDSMTHFDAQIESIKKNLDEAEEKVKKLRLVLSDDDKYDSGVKSLSGIEKMIEIIEKRPKNAFNCAQKTELKALGQITQTAFEDRIEKVYKVLSEINSKINLIKSENTYKRVPEKPTYYPDDKSSEDKRKLMTSFKYFENSLHNGNKNDYSDFSSEESAF